jgi:hypothetical protein
MPCLMLEMHTAVPRTSFLMRIQVGTQIMPKITRDCSATWMHSSVA